MDKNEAIRLLRGGRAGIEEWNRRRCAGDEVPSLSGINLVEAELRKCDLHSLDLDGACLIAAKLRGADLSGASLRGAHLSDSRIRVAGFAGTNMRSVDLSGALIIRADFIGSDLRQACFVGTILREARMAGANLSEARFCQTIVASDLTDVVGLDEVIHEVPSFVAFDSIHQNGKRLPDRFLRGCGLADDDISYLQSKATSCNRKSSCFISYSAQDEALATNLYADLQASGIRCWKWNHDARIGKKVWSEIDQAIRDHDKLLFIISQASLSSPYVLRELERALDEEGDRLSRQHNGTFSGEPSVLIPIRVDDSLDNWEHGLKRDITSRVIADARGSNMHPEVYTNLRDQLIATLTAVD